MLYLAKHRVVSAEVLCHLLKSHDTTIFIYRLTYIFCVRKL